MHALHPDMPLTPSPTGLGVQTRAGACASSLMPPRMPKEAGGPPGTGAQVRGAPSAGRPAALVE